ncbi:MAG: chromosome segregation protein SMC [Anaerovoracaceae bacterium]
MYFKRLEMHGFKSFAQPVSIEFNRGITCVVGPNGSGKSNISDAIRWVLGEQSPKMLRGGKMEEVIFSGTANRKSRGMAEVTLIIDNQDGRLNIDYNEVAITRRMFRSGESEYSINNNQCRLRDIRELIMDTGIGVDGYSIIGQGKISDIVSNKTQSRREIFEEAAGIVMYRTKKAESERKLKSTRDNLERVKDIVGEIEGRIDDLRDDSIKATEYIKLRDRYKVLEINITLQNIENLDLKNEYIKDDILELTNELDQAKEDKINIDRQLEINKQKGENLERLSAEAREKLMNSVEEINSLVNRGQVNKERLIAIEENTKRYEKEIIELKEKLEKEDRNGLALAGEKAQLYKEVEIVNQALQEKIQDHARVIDKIAQATAKVDQGKNLIFQEHSKISGKQAEITSLDNLRCTLENRKQQIVDEKDIGEDYNKDTLDQLNKSKMEQQDLEEEFSDLKIQGQQAHKDHTDNRILERDLSKDLEKLRISIGQLSARKKTIEEMETNYEGYNYAVKYIMKSGLIGIEGVVAELIHVPFGFETAIETAMGATLQNIICTDDTSAQKAISMLKQNRSGRLTFLPLNSINTGRRNPDDRLKESDGFRGFAVDCIDFDEKYTRVMEYLLGRVVVVDTMGNAIKMSKMVTGLRYVTLEGEIINAGGAITGGRYRNKTANLLERKREIKTLQTQLEEKMVEKENTVTKLEGLRKAIEDGAWSISGLEEACRQKELEVVTKRNEIAMTENALSDFKASSLKWQEELANIQMESQSSDGMIKILEEEITKGNKLIEKTEGEIEESLDLCKEYKNRQEAISEEITAYRIQVGACESKKNNVDSIVARINETITGFTLDLESKSKSLSKLVAEKQNLDGNHEDIESVVKEKEAVKANLEEYIEDLTKERAAAIAHISDLTKTRETTDEKIGRLQTQKYELEIKEAKNETQLDTYKGKLWEDFEVSYIQAIEFKKNDFDLKPAVKENRQIKSRMKELGEVNVGAIAEYETVKERYEFLTAQQTDILEAMGSLEAIIKDMDKTIRARFKESFDQVVLNFEKVFRELFKGGAAELRLDDEQNPLESGIEIIAQPPGKKLQNINLLSGGEKTMTAIALMFAVLKTKPTPFCILDEVEAALDDANIQRFANYLKQFKEIQFTLVTHQKATMEYADVLYGVTMPEQGISKILSLNLGEDFVELGKGE